MKRNLKIKKSLLKVVVPRIMSATIQTKFTSNYIRHLIYNVKLVIFDSKAELFIFSNEYASYTVEGLGILCKYHCRECINS